METSCQKQLTLPEAALRRGLKKSQGQLTGWRRKVHHRCRVRPGPARGASERYESPPCRGQRLAACRDGNVATATTRLSERWVDLDRCGVAIERAPMTEIAQVRFVVGGRRGACNGSSSCVDGGGVSREGAASRVVTRNVQIDPQCFHEVEIRRGTVVEDGLGAREC